MQFFDCEVLADVCALSMPLLVTGLVLGLVLWLLGWRTHRFWVVLIMTALAGIHGLYQAPVFRAQPLLASLLLAVAAGVLALALVRLLAFLAGGGVGLLLIQALAPAWNQPLLAFVACGLVGVLLFRLWMMALSSFAGALLIGYATLGLLNRSETLQAVAWADRSSVLLNWSCGGLTLFGFAFQFFMDRRRQAKKQKKKESGEKGDFVLLPAWAWSKPGRKAG